MRAFRSELALPLYLLFLISSVQPFLIINTGTAGTATTTTTGTTTTGTVGTVGNIGTLGTLTLGTTTLGTALASLGVLGVLKLGVLAVATKLAAIAGFVVGKKFAYLYREPPEHSSYNHHYVPVYTPGYSGYGTYGSYGGYSSGSGGHYHKRSVDGSDEYNAARKAVVLEEEEALSLVHEADSSRCGERLVCELARRQRKGPLLSDEQSILELVKQRPTRSPRRLKTNYRRLYSSALKAGYKKRSCRLLFPSCPFNSHQLMALVRSMGRDLLQDSLGFLGSKPDEQILHPEEDLNGLGMSKRSMPKTKITDQLNKRFESVRELYDETNWIPSFGPESRNEAKENDTLTGEVNSKTVKDLLLKNNSTKHNVVGKHKTYMETINKNIKTVNGLA